ncbi:MAG: hypothetical protein MZU84_09490 [Sphingobacterium sp.]|nr:hypothetical protein [Sphingobacterium sp.]
MKNALRYQDFIGSVHFSAEDDCFFGKIEGIDDLVTFEGRDVDELKRGFPGSGRGLHRAVPAVRPASLQVL